MAAAISPTTRLGNYTQILSQAVQVSGTARAVKEAGRKDEFAYQLMKAAKALKRDLEYNLLQNTGSSAGSSSTARQFGTVDAFLATNTIALGSGGANPAAPGGVDPRTDGSTTVAVSEANVKTLLADIYTAGGKPNCMLVSAANKQTFSGFSGNSATRYVEFDKEKQQKLFTAYDVYVSDFGEISVVPERFGRGRDVLALDTDYWKLAYLRPFHTEPLAKTGDSDISNLLCEVTLESSNEQASGGIFDTTG